MNIQELKLKSSEQLITQAEELGIENDKQKFLEDITIQPSKKLLISNVMI